jgi:hypothetical protein
MRLVSSDGTVVVETIRLSGTSGRDGEWLRVKRGGYHVADVRTVAELAELGIDLADLSEAIRSLSGHVGLTASRSARASHETAFI